MKTNLVITLAAALMLLAGSAFALDFNPIADADFIGYPAYDAAHTAVLSQADPGPGFDAEWNADLGPADAPVLVAATFDSVADADILAGRGTLDAGAATAVAAACAAGCMMDCGQACTAHCGTGCAVN
ncbi:MAG TPA: hypothetical protein PLQ13_05205 [Candidatus Krumholzibacteria bacterium]|nr:hypothetical protein [Candidatus Krumholzibacteria bacterium]